MTREYAPQVTSHRTYESQEKSIYKAFVADYGHEEASAIAKANTSFQLYYMSVSEVIECLVRAGIAEDAATELALAFAQSRAKAEVLQWANSPVDDEPFVANSRAASNW